MHPRTCKWCETAFAAKDPRTLTCSNSCRSKYEHHRCSESEYAAAFGATVVRTGTYRKECQWCGDPFETTNITQRNCCPLCGKYLARSGGVSKAQWRAIVRFREIQRLNENALKRAAKEAEKADREKERERKRAERTAKKADLEEKRKMAASRNASRNSAKGHFTGPTRRTMDRMAEYIRNSGLRLKTGQTLCRVYRSVYKTKVAIVYGGFCRWCGKPFLAIRKDARFCMPSCEKAYNRYHCTKDEWIERHGTEEVGHRVYKRICQWCEEPFETENINQLNCCANHGKALAKCGGVPRSVWRNAVRDRQEKRAEERRIIREAIAAEHAAEIERRKAERAARRAERLAQKAEDRRLRAIIRGEEKAERRRLRDEARAAAREETRRRLDLERAEKNAKAQAVLLERQTALLALRELEISIVKGGQIHYERSEEYREARAAYDREWFGSEGARHDEYVKAYMRVFSQKIRYGELTTSCQGEFMDRISDAMRRKDDELNGTIEKIVQRRDQVRKERDLLLAKLRKERDDALAEIRRIRAENKLAREEQIRHREEAFVEWCKANGYDVSDREKARHALYESTHSEERKAYSKWYHEANRERLNAYHRHYYEAHREEILAYQKARYAQINLVQLKERKEREEAQSAAEERRIEETRRRFRSVEMALLLPPEERYELAKNWTSEERRYAESIMSGIGFTNTALRVIENEESMTIGDFDEEPV